MKKLLSMLFPAVFLFMGIISSARAQNGVHPVAKGKFEVRFMVKSLDCSASPRLLTIAVQVRSSTMADTFLMGDANYRFRFKTTQLRLLGTTPTYAQSLVSQENFSSALSSPNRDFNYGIQNLNGSGEGPTEGIVSLNTFYSGSNQGGKLVNTTWTTVSCIKFTVLNGTNCFDLTWNKDKVDPLNPIDFPVTGMNEVYDLVTDPSYDYKQANVGVTGLGYFGNLNQCATTYCSPILAVNDINTTALNTPVSGQVLTNDIGSGLVVTTTPIANPANGTVVLNANGTYTYTPATGFSGTDTFKYKICDNITPQKCDTALVTITIIPPVVPGVNAPPVAQNDTKQTAVGMPVSGSVLGNDFDPNPGQTLTVTTTPVTPPVNGTVILNTNGTYTYTPAPGFSGADSFTYKVCDNGSPVLCANATVYIDIVPKNTPATANDKPVAGDDAGTTLKNVPITGTLNPNDSDPNAGQILAYTTTPIATPAHGTVTITPTGGYTYTPTTGYTGPDAFTYKVCDNGTPILCDTATVYLTVTPSPNNPPVVTPPTVTPTTPEDPATPITVCVTYTDADVADTHTPTICGALNGTAIFASQNTASTPKQVCFTYKPNPNFNGTDSVCVKVCDNNGACTTIKVPVVVTPVPDPPTMNPPVSVVPEDTLVAVKFCYPVTDPDAGDIIQAITVCGAPLHASNFSYSTDNVNHTVCVSYKPQPNFAGKDTVCLKICDSFGLCTDVKFPILVAERPDAPVVTKTPQTVGTNSTNNPLCLPISDPDVGDTHTVTICGAAKNGTATPTVNNVTHQVCLNYTPTPNFAGKDSVCIKICDSYGLCTTVIIPITVTSVPTAPSVVVPPFITPEDSTKKVCMTITDPNPNSSFTIAPCATPKNGTAQMTVDNTTGTLCITYTPYPNFNGKDTVCVKVCDNTGLCTDVKVPIVVTPVNDKPVAINDVNITQKATPVSGNVLTNDTDPDTGQTLTVTTTPVANPINGTVVLNPNGTYTYTPNPTFVGTDSFKYKVCDSGTPTLCDTATVVIEIYDPAPSPINKAPLALNDNTTTPQGTPVTIAVKNNDIDPDGNTLGTPTLATTPTKGTAVVNPDGTVTYTPNPTATGSDSFKYVVCDNGTPSKCDSATVTVEITPPTGPVNIAPTAVDDAKLTFKNTPVNGTVAPNDTDPNAGQTLTFASTSTPLNGTLTSFNPTTGAYTYTPNNNFVGNDKFTYKVCDNGTPSLCSNATVYLTVTTPPNTPPTLGNPPTTPTMPEDGGSITVCLPITDPDVGDTHTVTPCGALNGIVTYSVDNTSSPHKVCATYTPNPNFNGADSICVKICDSFGSCVTKKVPVIVTPVNDPPVVVPVVTPVPEDGTVTVCLPVADPDANDLHSVTMCAAPKKGTATLTVNNTPTPHQVCITYTPLPNFNGKDTVCIHVCDAAGLCTDVKIPFVVTPVNDAPIAKDDIANTPAGVPVSGNVLTNDTDPEGDPMTVTGPIAGAGPTKGTVVISPTGVYTYTPNPTATGTDTFKYQVCDNGTPSLCDTATVTITITPAALINGTNLPPIATPDVTSTPKGTPVVINVLANDADPEGLPLSNPTIATPPTKGTVVVNPNGTITYTPNPGVTGDDTFTYQVCDTGSPVACATTKVTVSVTPPLNVVSNEPPVPTDDAKTMNKNGTLTTSVATNDSDPNAGQLLSFSNTSSPVNGTLTFNPNGTFTYTPTLGFVGNDSFTYKVCDNGTPVMCSNATVYLTVIDPTVVQPANTLPVALDDNSTTPKGVAVIIPVKANDTYTAGTLGNPTAISTPANGTVVTNANGTMTYTPNPTFVGVDTYKYKICDASNLAKCDSAVVTITVKDATIGFVNNPPVTIDDYKITVKATPVSGTVAANDSDPDAGQTLSFTKLTNPTNGSVTFNPDGTYTYTPNATFVGTDAFTYKVCDSFSPSLCATATAYITILDKPCVSLDLKVFLQGPYDQTTGLMKTTLNQRGLLPGQTPVGAYAIPTPAGHPYNTAPFSYTGTETATTYASTVVDWVLVTLRTNLTVASKVFQAAGLLNSDGTITFLNPCFVIPNGSYYVLIEHRNHTGVMSPTAIPVTSGKITFDFTTQQSFQLTNPPSYGQKAVGTKFAMFAGDGKKANVNDNYDINFNDSQLWKTISGNFDVYLLGDFNMDADTNFGDNSLWKTNSGKFSGVQH